MRDFASLHSVASDATAFTEAIGAALAGRGPAIPDADSPLLQANSCDARLDQMMAIIEARPSREGKESGSFSRQGCRTT